MTVAATLPGITFEAVPRGADETLPRMDVAGFVGFAARGPIDLPVLVEDPVGFRDIFGADPELARTDDGTPVRGYLGAAVEAFFANGGQRAWVVRVATTGPEGAVTNRFVVPGCFVPGAPTEGPDGWRLLTLRARSAGAWSDGLSVGASLEVTTTRALDLGRDPELDREYVVLDHVVEARPGDLLRVVADEKRALLVEVTDVLRDPHGVRATFAAGDGYLVSQQLPAADMAAYRLGAGPALPVPGFAIDHSGEQTRAAVDKVHENDGIGSGDVLVVEAGPAGGAVLVTLGEEHSESLEDTRRFAVAGAMAVGAVPADWPTIFGEDSLPEPVVVELQRVRLGVRDGEALVAQLGALGLGERHPRALLALPDDLRVFTALAGATTAVSEPPPIAAELALTDFEGECLTPRFPVAGPVDRPRVLPLGLPTDPTSVAYGGLVAGAMAATPVRNGLDRFDASLFVDPSLAGLGVDTILPVAWDLAHVRRPTRGLTGLHTLATLEDVTLVCVPDAVHTGWDRREIPAPDPLTAPELQVDRVDREDVHLSWSTVVGATGYQLEEDLTDGFVDSARSLQDRAEAVRPARSPCPAPHYYRVRAVRGAEDGPWSNTVLTVAPRTTFAQCAVPPEPEALAPTTSPPLPPTVVWRARTPAEAGPWLTLRAVQSALLRWCAARGDVVGVLGLPGSFTVQDAVRHVSVLRGDRPAFDAAGRPAADAFLDGGVPALTHDEAFVLGYGAAYHPWPFSGRPGVDLRAMPPDGAIAGTYAAYAIDRGAWVAPARLKLAGPLALAPPIDDHLLPSLVAAGVNPLVQDPSGFLAITASTMSDFAAVRPVNVRRLIALLRRLAQRIGPSLVFEPNDRELQRLVQMRFERLLTDLYARGAFFGATPEEAFEVSTGETLNPPQALDAGRFVVEVRVAPSRPLEFITVRLVLSGGRGTEEPA